MKRPGPATARRSSGRVPGRGRRGACRRQEEGCGSQAQRAGGERKGGRVRPAPAEPVLLTKPCRQEGGRREPVRRPDEAKGWGQPRLIGQREQAPARRTDRHRSCASRCRPRIGPRRPGTLLGLCVTVGNCGLRDTLSGSRMLRGLPAPDAREAALSGASSGGSRGSRGTGSSSGSTVYVRSGSPMSTAPSLLDRSTLARRSGSFHGDSMPLGVPTRVVAESSTKSPGCAVAEAIPGRARSRRWWPPSMPCDLSR